MIRAGVLGLLLGLAIGIVGALQYYLVAIPNFDSRTLIIVSQVGMWLSWVATLFIMCAGAFLVLLGYEIRRW